MNINEYLKPETILDHGKALEEATERVYNFTMLLETIEQEVADEWERMRQQPDFKPGKSNDERDAKLRISNPKLMDRLDLARADLALAKFEKERLDIQGRTHRLLVDYFSTTVI